MSVFQLFGRNTPADADLALAGFIDLQQLVLVDDDAAGGKIGSLDVFHELFARERIVLDERDLGVDDLFEIVRGR